MTVIMRCASARRAELALRVERQLQPDVRLAIRETTCKGMRGETLPEWQIVALSDMADYDADESGYED